MVKMVWIKILVTIKNMLKKTPNTFPHPLHTQLKDLKKESFAATQEDFGGKGDANLHVLT